LSRPPPFFRKGGSSRPRGIGPTPASRVRRAEEGRCAGQARTLRGSGRAGRIARRRPARPPGRAGQHECCVTCYTTKMLRKNDMHLQGFTVGQIGPIINHVTRHGADPDQSRYTYSNEAIDAARTAENYAISATPDPAAFIAGRVEAVDRKPRKNSNLLSSIVVTLPKNDLLEGREREFFEAVAALLSERVGVENVIGGYVHLDESQPHMHFLFTPVVRTPVTENDKSRPLLDKDGEQRRDRRGVPLWERRQKLDERGRPVFKTAFAQSKMFTREGLEALHPDMERGLRERFGFRAGIRLEDEGERQLSRLDQNEYKSAKARLAEQREELEAQEAAIAEARKAVSDAAEAVTAAMAFAEKARALVSDAVEFLKSHGLADIYRKWVAKRHPDAPSEDRAARDLERAAERLRAASKNLGRSR
jgi:hypothetical protein